MTNRTSIRRLAATAAVALVAALAAPAASAATTGGDATDGTLDWGVKESFRDYVTGRAGGEIELDGATENDDGSFRFGGATGTVGAGAADLAFAGSVRFTGHDGALDATISDPVVRIDGESGSLAADVSSVSRDGEPVEHSDVVLAELELSGVSLEPDADGVVTVSGVPAVLSEAGAPAFGGFYDAGETLDPVSFTVQTSGDDAGEEAAGSASDESSAVADSGMPWWLVATGGLILAAVVAASVLLARRRSTSSTSGAGGE